MSSTTAPVRPSSTNRRDLDTLQFLDLEAKVDHDEEEEEVDNDGLGEDDDPNEMDDDTARSQEDRQSPRIVDNIDNEEALPPMPPKKKFEVVCYAMGYCSEKRVFNVILFIHYCKAGDGCLFLEMHDPLAAAQIMGKFVFVLHSHDSQYGNVAMRRLGNADETRRSLRFSSNTIMPGTWVRLSNPKFGRPKRATRASLQPNELPPHDPHDYIPPQPELPPPNRSRYHNDLALVVEVSPTSTQRPMVLVVPRLDETLVTAGVRSIFDRKCRTPLLLTEETVSDWDGLDGLSIAQGLQMETVERRVVVPIPEPPSSYKVALFLASKHAFMREHFLPVRQWTYYPGESVSSLRGDWTGTVTTVMEQGVETI
ncbi:hypothetical protein PQX77_008655 [Marasmius sp. AFHP31]|nr:hypothetical protein PQX77_008655 [Marasmius sp. AFHP31]